MVLEKLFTKNVFKVCTPKDEKFLIQLSETKGFHIADAEVLALAKEGGYFAVIDDEVARKTAKIYGIHYVGTPYILMQAVYDGIISKNDAKQAVNDMVSAGWRCNVESYAKIMEILEKI